MKLPKKAGSKGHEWAIDPDYEDMFDHGSFLRRRYRFKNGKKKDKNSNCLEPLACPQFGDNSPENTALISQSNASVQHTLQQSGYMTQMYSPSTVPNGVWNPYFHNMNQVPHSEISMYREQHSPVSVGDVSGSDCASSPEVVNQQPFEASERLQNCQFVPYNEDIPREQIHETFTTRMCLPPPYPVHLYHSSPAFYHGSAHPPNAFTNESRSFSYSMSQNPQSDTQYDGVNVWPSN